jgi:hypothetical protein
VNLNITRPHGAQWSSRPEQQIQRAALVAAGATVAVAYGLDDALAQLEGWGLVRGSCQGRRP